MKKLRQNARVSEVDDVSDKVVRICKAQTVIETDSYLSGKVEELEEASEKLTTANKRDKAVSQLDDADSERDEAYRALERMTTGYLYYPDAQMQACAQTIQAVLKKYAGITSESYARESALIKSLLGDLASESLTTALSALAGMQALVTALSEKQAAFDVVNDEYNAAVVAATSEDNATSLKKVVLSLLNDDIVLYLTTMRKVNAASYENLAALVENEISRMNEQIAARSKSASSADTTGSDTSETA